MLLKFIKHNIIKWRSDELYHDIIDSLVTALEAKDNYTKGHSERIADMTNIVSKILGIKGKEFEDIHMAAHLHDIGKIGVKDSILNKPNKLSPTEWDEIKLHPVIGYDILNKSKKLCSIAKIVLHHHERWDGNGYPHKLKGYDIPLGSRIIAVCDSIDAMTSNRPYRKSLSSEQCKIEIIKNKGIMYDPIIIESVEKNWNKFNLDD